MDTVDAPVAGWRSGAPPPQAGPALEEELDSSAPLLLADEYRNAEERRVGPDGADKRVEAAESGGGETRIRSSTRTPGEDDGGAI